jgi:hypothetical protein
MVLNSQGLWKNNPQIFVVNNESYRSFGFACNLAKVLTWISFYTKTKLIITQEFLVNAKKQILKTI